MLESETLVGGGAAPGGSPIGTAVATIASPGRGRYVIWGVVRHFMDDGCALRVGPTLVIPLIPNQAMRTEAFGPISVDITNSITNIVVELLVATGGPGQASASVYARNLTKPRTP